MQKYQLDPAEEELLQSIERGEWKPVKGMRSKIREYAEYARHTFKKDQRISIRMNKRDLIGLKTKAVDEGMPYQTLIASVLHKYVVGQLAPRP